MMRIRADDDIFSATGFATTCFATTFSRDVTKAQLCVTFDGEGLKRTILYSSFFAPLCEIVRVLREKRYLNPTSPTPHGGILALHLQSLASFFLLVLYIVSL